MRYVKAAIYLVAVLAIAILPDSARAKRSKQITLMPIGRYNAGPGIESRTYLFIGLERTGGIIVYDVTDPFQPAFVDYVNTGPDDISPEGLLFIKEEDSPNGKPLLVVSHEISSTTTIFEINKHQQKNELVAGVLSRN
jgi:choice-of-anchor I-like protein